MKNALRQAILQKRKALGQDERLEFSKKITDFIIGSKRYEKAEMIFTFVSMGQEVNTYPLIKQAWQDGKKVAVPIAKKGGKMYFVKLSSFQELRKTGFGVMEPQIEEEQEVLPNERDIFLVPGSVFDERGNRYGYGGGFYDRYFERFPKLYKIGVAFSFQVAGVDLQVESFDIAVDCIITEKGLTGGSNYEYFD
ncbi:5-formyltetrahydrofolate cyclo-ligase [Anaerotignum sp.]|uniref:5-formyltetrahydrofolate cyclo-ligase n=1 Tax=Anaerotignum sp. TaxID=2039241 RepID=UPI003317F065